MRVGIHGKVDGIGAGRDAVGRIKDALGLPERSGHVPVQGAGSVALGEGETHLREAPGAAFTPRDAKAEPHRVKRAVLDERDDCGAARRGFLGECEVRRASGKVRVDRADQRLLFEHEVVRQREIGVCDVADVAGERLERVRVAALGDEGRDECIGTRDVLCEIGENAGRCHDARARVLA